MPPTNSGSAEGSIEPSGHEQAPSNGAIDPSSIPGHPNYTGPEEFRAALTGPSAEVAPVVHERLFTEADTLKESARRDEAFAAMYVIGATCCAALREALTMLASYDLPDTAQRIAETGQGVTNFAMLSGIALTTASVVTASIKQYRANKIDQALAAALRQE